VVSNGLRSRHGMTTTVRLQRILPSSKYWFSRGPAIILSIVEDRPVLLFRGKLYGVFLEAYRFTGIGADPRHVGP
jgi:hypothetical protein